MTRIRRQVLAAFAAMLSVTAAAASPPKDLNRLFAVKAPWEFPHLKASPELEGVAHAAIQNYRTIDPKVKIELTGICHDPRHGLAFLTFGIAKDSAIYETDFLLIYVYDRSMHRLLGHVFYNLA